MRNDNTASDESIARALAQEEQTRRHLEPTRNNNQVFDYPGDVRRRQQQNSYEVNSVTMCPGGCGSLQSQATRAATSCNRCNRMISTQERAHVCGFCSYHLCEFCNWNVPPSRGQGMDQTQSTAAYPPAMAPPSHAMAPPPQQSFRGPPQFRQRTPMCHVPCVMGKNAVCVEMMVDTGAESSVISAELAKELGLLNEMDRSAQGIAAGVGRARILGRIRNAIVTLGHLDFEMEFMVLEVPGRMLLLGLDQMRKYKCIVNLEKDVLVFGGSGGVEVPMLPPDQQRGFLVPPGVGGACAIS